MKKLCIVLFVLVQIVFWTDAAKAQSKAQPITPQTTIWPDWVFRHWVWEDESTQQSAQQLVDDYLAHDIPVGAIIIDSPWETQYNNFQFDTSLYQDPQGMVNYFHSKNVKVNLWITAMINVDDTVNYAYAKANNYLLRKNSGDDSTTTNWWKGDGRLIDLFNPAAKIWWKSLMDSVLLMGIDGWKCDAAEFFLAPLYSPYTTGTVTRSAYSDKYYRFFFDTTRAALGNDRVIFARPVDNYGTGICGSFASFAPVDVNFAGWVGDQDATFTGLKHALNNMYCSAQGNYLSFGSDIGGYREDTNYPNTGRSKELFIRWAQLGALSPIMENGGGGEHRPWKFDTLNTETTDIYRKFVKLHDTLGAYFMQTAINEYAGGKSMLHFFNNTDYSYLIGTDLFVAPFLSSGTSINVTFPAGTDNWVYLFDTSKVYAGGTTVNNMTVPLDEYPVFAKQGAWIMSVASTILNTEQTNIYPNPTNGKCVLSFSSVDHGMAQINILDLSGRQVVAPVKTAIHKGGNKIELNVSDLSSGTYFVQINEENHIQTKRLIKVE